VSAHTTRLQQKHDLSNISWQTKAVGLTARYFQPL